MYKYEHIRLLECEDKKLKKHRDIKPFKSRRLQTK